MDDELAERGVEPIGVAERRQVAPGADEAFLDRVARELRVPQDQPCGRVQSRDGRAGKQCEGVMIAPLRPLDEVSLVHDNPRWCAAVWSRSHGMASIPGDSFRARDGGGREPAAASHVAT